LIVQVTNETRTLQYSLSQLAGTGNTIYEVGRTYYNQCMAWSFGSQQLAQSGASDWVLVRLLIKVSEGEEPPPADVNDYVVQRCRNGTSSCACFLQVLAYEKVNTLLFYEWREPMFFSLSSTSNPASSLVGFSTTGSLFRYQFIGGLPNDGITTGTFSIIGQE
jgi:hypothetical protein